MVVLVSCNVIYGSSKPIPLIGKTQMNATVNNETCVIEFHVIAGNGKPLLGRKSATELGLSNTDI
jgi:hypothetical protein